MSNQLKKHLRKRSKASRIKHIEDTLRFNPQDKSAQEALVNLQYPTKKEEQY